MDYIKFDKEAIEKIIEKYQLRESLVSDTICVRSIIIETQEESEKYGYPIGTWCLINANYEL